MDVAAIRLLNMEALIASAEIGSALRLAEMVGTDPSYLSSLRYPERTKRTMGGSLARKIEEGCALGRGWMDVLHASGEDGGAKAVNRVPIISWKDVPTWGTRRNHMSPDTKRWDTTIPTTTNTFAVVVVDNAMEPELCRGATLVVEPGLKARSDDYVIVVVSDDADAMCRSLVINGKHKLLVPANKRHPVHRFEGEARIIGVVREHTVRYR